MHLILFLFLFVALLLAVFVAGMKYGIKLESNAYAELGVLKTALRATGVRIETYLTSDVSRIRDEIERVLKYPFLKRT